MGKKDTTLLVDNVIKEGIRCCAKKCPASKEGTIEKFFFSFPKCDLSDEDSINRCRIWVRRAGNVELIKYKLMDLPGKFFLCCSHFPDWTAKDSNCRCIPHDAIPAYFDCSPLSKSLMHAYAKIALIDEENSDKTNDLSSPSEIQEPESIRLHLSPVTPEVNVEAETIIKEEPAVVDVSAANRSASSESLGTQPMDSSMEGKDLQSDGELNKKSVPCETEDVSAHSSLHGEDQNLTISQENIQSNNKEDQQYEISKTQKVPNDAFVDKINILSNGPLHKESVVPAEVTKDQSIPQSSRKGDKPRVNIERRNTPTRKAKQDAVYKIFNQPNLDKEIEDEEPVKKIPKLSVSKPEILPLQNLRGDVVINTNLSQHTSVQESEPPGSSSPLKTSLKECSTKTVFKDVLNPERTQAKSIIVSNDILSRLGKPYEKVLHKVGNNSSYVPSRLTNAPVKNVTSSPSTSPVIEDEDRMTILNAETGQFEIIRKSGRHVLNESHPFTSDCSNGYVVEPVGRSVGVQTEVQNEIEGREILKILDSDEKLSIFSGLPSYDVLDSITDATLKMVMNNQAMISDIEPTMREWIILTCTKFMLGLPLEALSVMFEVPEDECKKIVEKTCLFMRKTLSLPDCQKYVWLLPSAVLTGIADCSDELIMSNNRLAL